MTLNLNCCLLIVPVTKTVIRVLNDLAAGYYRSAQRRWAMFEKIFTSPSLARYIPLGKNIECHKLIATTTLALTIVHVVCYFMNYWQAPGFTAAR